MSCILADTLSDPPPLSQSVETPPAYVFNKVDVRHLSIFCFICGASMISRQVNDEACGGVELLQLAWYSSHGAMLNHVIPHWDTVLQCWCASFTPSTPRPFKSENRHFIEVLHDAAIADSVIMIDTWRKRCNACLHHGITQWSDMFARTWERTPSSQDTDLKRAVDDCDPGHSCSLDCRYSCIKLAMLN